MKMKVYGFDNIFLIIDEGGGIMEDYFGCTWIAPSTGEEGSMNVQVTVAVPGGHSSLHLAATFPPVLSPMNPFSAFAQCLALHGPIDDELRRALASEWTWGDVARIMAGRDAGDWARLSTTQAVDIVSGGVKVNALPEEAHVVVNHRVSADFSLQAIQDRYVRLLTPEAARFNLKVVSFGEDVPVGATRYVRLTALSGAEASPVTPAEGSAWEHLVGTDTIAAPYLSTGGTDTRSYVNLTRAIFRFQAVRDAAERVGIHTVDERVHVNGHMHAIDVDQTPHSSASL
ncbi:hypothetical protein B0H10DRAFT_2437736 [Mycena sp. CBHHK59/15]|nr:hypothetical protein B0H10DRAFT_2437736 [Mycena sp. CBHHK59/15]